jgi:phosphoglycolate phosphatase-like HAD superfamily hydrolase
VLHIVWDWNGTLVDDLPIVVDCVNAALAVIGEPPIDADDYREHFARPVNRFYESLLRRPIAPSEWETLDHAITHSVGRRDRIGLCLPTALFIQNGRSVPSGLVLKSQPQYSQRAETAHN